MKPTLEQIRNEATTVSPETFVICWDRFEEAPELLKDFEHDLQQAELGLQLLEYAYTTLILRGENIAIPGMPTSLKYDEIEQLEAKLVKELTIGYQLQDVWQRYQAIKSL